MRDDGLKAAAAATKILMSKLAKDLAVPDLAWNNADEGAATLRKISWRLLPLIAVGYGLATLDRNNIGLAALQMNRDLHFSASTYGLGAGLFSIGYALCEIPSNLLLYRFGARRWIARIMLTWGILAMGMALIKSPLHLYVMRFLLGMAEAGFFPGIAYYLSQWFPARMRARAISRFYVAAPIAAILSGVLAGPLLNLGGTLGVSGWQWLFLIEGLPPVLLSIVFLIHLPNDPGEAKWLSLSERTWLADQLEKDAPRQGRHTSLAQTFLDPRIWQLGLLAFCLLTCGYSYLLTAPIILQQVTGFSARNVGFLVAVNGLASAIGMVLNAMHSDRGTERCWHIAVPALVMAGAFVVSGLSLNPIWVISGLGVAITSLYCTQGVLYTIPSSFLAGKSAAAGMATVTTMGILGGFAGPAWMGWMRDVTGSYQVGLMSMAVPSLAGALIILSFRSKNIS